MMELSWLLGLLALFVKMRIQPNLKSDWHDKETWGSAADKLIFYDT
jgi:hypothetical protein